ncbi:hypothetical protein D3C87_2113520 [compost metagenome]
MGACFSVGRHPHGHRVNGYLFTEMLAGILTHGHLDLPLFRLHHPDTPRLICSDADSQ